MKYILFAFLIAGVWFANSMVGEWRTNQTINRYTFSNTSSWNPELLSFAARPVKSVPDWQVRISIPLPPANSSLETKEELAKLVSYKGLRTPDKIRQIENELSIETIEIGGRPMSDYFDSAKYPHTALLFKDPYEDIVTIVLVLKQKYDRVRPHILEPEIMPVIEVPGHPAYPSGHSTQAHFMAYLLSEILPEKEAELTMEADQIAKNREIAGVHYESDTEAGKLLAQQFVDLLLTDPEIESLIKMAHSELEQ